MEKLETSVFSDIEIPNDSEYFVDNDILYLKKWNWDYQNCLDFQEIAQKKILQNRKLKIYIFCNHPHCFTLGRGNERGRDDLVDFNESLSTHLDFPLYKIHRGGGITFHYPGQWIFYPIVSIGQNYTLDEHMCWLLKSVKEVLKNHFKLDGVMATKKLVGVWNERKKLASIGVGLNRFVTEHGLALNLIYDEKMFKELLKINPCGMDSATYVALDRIVEGHKNLLEEFHTEYMKTLTK